MRAALAPVKEWSRTHLSAIPARLTVTDQSTLTGAHVFATSVKRNLRGRGAEEWSEAA